MNNKAMGIIDNLEEDIIILKEQIKELNSEIDAKDLIIQEQKERILHLETYGNIY